MRLLSAIRIYKDWLVTKVIIALKKKPFHIKTSIDYLILTFKKSGCLPAPINALELFGMYGLWVTKHYAHYCEHVDMWEIDSNYVYYARKFKETNVTIIEGDSVLAVQNGSISKKYNFVMIDNPLISPYGNGLIEHFDVLPQIFDIAEDKFILIFNVLLDDPNNLYNQYHFNSEIQIRNKLQWMEKRKWFYGTKEGLNLNPQEYTKIYSDKFTQWGMEVQFSTFLPRNSSVGFLGFALRRR